MTAAHVAASLRAERTAMQAFLELLGEEQQALIRGDADQVAAGIARKSEWLGKLARHAGERREFLNKQQFPADRSGMDAWIAAHPDSGTLAAEWHELLKITHQAWQANHANGLLISVQMQSNQQSLAALAAAARSASLYGRDGQTVGAWGSRTLGAA